MIPFKTCLWEMNTHFDMYYTLIVIAFQKHTHTLHCTTAGTCTYTHCTTTETYTHHYCKDTTLYKSMQIYKSTMESEPESFQKSPNRGKICWDS